MAASDRTITVQDGANADGRLSQGDTLLVRNTAGQEVSRKTLTADDIYAMRFRENMLKNAGSIGAGWEFTEKLVSIKGAQLAQPETRQYTDSNGARGTEKVVERNNFWEVVERGSNRFLVMRNTDNAGKPVLASDAINDVFTNRKNYAFDCASPMPLMNLKSTLDTIGKDDFNRNAGQLLISSWYDQYDTSRFDGGYLTNVRTAAAGEITVNGKANLAGETAKFDPAKGDKLIPGNTYYFDLPGDTTTAEQGWNAVYMGQKADGSHEFWSNSVGLLSVTFDGKDFTTTGRLAGYYLGAVVADPNVARIKDWDDDASVVR